VQEKLVVSGKKEEKSEQEMRVEFGKPLRESWW